MSACASCGKALSSDLDECAHCNNEPSRDVFLSPGRQKQNIAFLKLAVLGAILGGGVLVTVVRRLPEFKEAFGPALLYVLGGLAVVILLFRLFVGSTTERL